MRKQPRERVHVCSPVDVDDLARRVADEVLRRLLDPRASISVAGISSRPREEEATWRDNNEGPESSGHTDTDNDGESTWSMNEARRLLKATKAKSKRSK